MGPSMNKSYFWAFDNRHGWNWTEFQSFWNDFYRDDEPMKYVEFSALILLPVIGLILNIYLLVTLCVSRRLKLSHSRFVVAIMCCSIIWLPFVCIIAIGRLTHGWVFGDIICRLSMFMTINTSFMKIVFMAIISIDRYVKVVRDYQMSERLRITLIVLAAIIVTSTTGYVTIPNTFSQPISYRGDNFHICTAAFPYHETLRLSMIYVLAVFTAYFFLPAIIITICYTRILVFISKSARAVSHHLTRRSTKKVVGRSGSKLKQPGSGYSRTTRILVLIAVLFVLMWIPLFGCLTALTLDHVLERFQMSSRVMMGCMCLTVINTLIEPLLYTLTAKSYRKALLDNSCCSKLRRTSTVHSVDERLQVTSSSATS